MGEFEAKQLVWIESVVEPPHQLSLQIICYRFTRYFSVFMSFPLLSCGSEENMTSSLCDIGPSRALKTEHATEITSAASLSRDSQPQVDRDAESGKNKGNSPVADWSDWYWKACYLYLRCHDRAPVNGWLLSSIFKAHTSVNFLPLLHHVSQQWFTDMQTAQLSQCYSTTELVMKLVWHSWGCKRSCITGEWRLVDLWRRLYSRSER